ncbi:MAG: DUF1826 domain-containing protein [Bacteriovoracia bacterium]
MEDFRDVETNLAVWKRRLPTCADAIDELLIHDKNAAQVAVDRGMDLELIPALLDEDLNLQAADSLALYQDIENLAGKFFELTGALRIGVRLERVESDNCRLFHVDQVKARLVSTYSGKGTEWLRNEDVNRSGLGQGDNDLVMRPGAKVQAMLPGWVGVMKGERGNAGAGLVHRSPPIEVSGLKRILLRMDVLA